MKRGEKVNIIISNRENKPIYEQIFYQLKNYIISGELKEGEMLPSIRNLAKDLKISVITTKRAYEELEREGYIYSVGGKGSYVAEKNTEILKEAQLREIEGLMKEICQIAPGCKLDNDDLIEMLKIIMEDEL